MIEINNESAIEVDETVLQRLTDRLDGGIVLAKGWFRTIDHSYVRNRDQAYFGSAGWPARSGSLGLRAHS